MDDEHATLTRLLSVLETNAAVAAKATIQRSYAPARALAGDVRIGDDCAAIPDGESFLLFAAEGMLESFVSDDPWFAGYSAVMVNLSDIAAMGGRYLAVVDVIWTPDLDYSSAIWAGMTAASQAYAVPIVGGHTTVTGIGGAFLAAAVLGRAQKLITSFDAVPNDDLLMAVDLRGSYRGSKPFWNASLGAPVQRLRDDLQLLPSLAERGWCRAGKDISNGGVVGTLGMLLECSRVGAELWLDQLPRPNGADLGRWLVSFPSFGYILSVSPGHTARVIALFNERGIDCAPVGRITETPSLVLSYGSARQSFRPKI
jgi:AIR synthase-related protein